MRIFSRPCLGLPATGALFLAFVIPSLHAETPEEQEVLTPVKLMFNGMTKRDPAAIKQPLLPGGTTDLFNLIRKDGKWLIASVADTGRKNCSAH